MTLDTTGPREHETDLFIALSQELPGLAGIARLQLCFITSRAGVIKLHQWQV